MDRVRYCKKRNERVALSMATQCIGVNLHTMSHAPRPTQWKAILTRVQHQQRHQQRRNSMVALVSKTNRR